MRRTLVALLVGATLPLAGCGGSGSDQTLTVFAAASLTTTFTELGRQFEAAHDGTTVRFSFGGSSDLVAQIRSGAPADVFASADTATMAELDGARDRHDFATNTLEIAVPPGNPAHVASLADLARPGVKVVTCAPEVPCGAATAAVTERAGVTLRPVSSEQSVTDVLGKVSTGEADAGLVYVTDVKAAGDSVQGVPFAESSSVVNTYPIVVPPDAEHRELAEQFLDLVLSDRGRRVLDDAGFGKP